MKPLAVGLALAVSIGACTCGEPERPKLDPEMAAMERKPRQPGLNEPARNPEQSRGVVVPPEELATPDTSTIPPVPGSRTVEEMFTRRKAAEIPSPPTPNYPSARPAPSR